MNIRPIKTRIMQPPQDDLLQVIRDAKMKIQENDVVVISSKVIAIHEGRCVKASDVDKEVLVQEESEVYFKDADSRWRISLKHGTFLAGAGIDESNASDHLILLPQDPQKSARELWNFLRTEFEVQNIAVIVADSHSAPMRYGTTGVALGWCGFEPVTYFVGEKDLFGREAQFTRINVADSLAGAGVFVMGELSEQTPISVIENAPHVRFARRDTSSELFIPPREDIYWPLLKKLYE